jgi:hypothetical protein
MTTRRPAEGSKNPVLQGISVLSAAQTGDSLAALVALRDTLARAIDECGSKRDLAALSRQLCAVRKSRTPPSRSRRYATR